MHFYAKCTSMFIIKAKYLCSTASFIKVITSHISWGLLLYYMYVVGYYRYLFKVNYANYDNLKYLYKKLKCLYQLDKIR